MDHFTRQMSTVALPIPRRDLHSPGDDWAGISGCWYGLFGRWKVGDPEPTPSVLPHIKFEPCKPEILDSLIKHHDQMSRVKAGPILQLATGLPWSDALPPIFFHGHGGESRRQTPWTVYCVRGVARLTTDSPPEIRFTIVLRKLGRDVARFEGVQVGGAQLGRGRRGIVCLSSWVEGGEECQAATQPLNAKASSAD